MIPSAGWMAVFRLQPQVVEMRDVVGWAMGVDGDHSALVGFCPTADATAVLPAHSQPEFIGYAEPNDDGQEFLGRPTLAERIAELENDAEIE